MNIGQPRRWDRLTAAEKDAEWATYHAAVARWSTPQPVQPAANVPAVASLAAAIVGLLILPLLLGAVAIVAGIVGWAKAREEGCGKAGVANWGIFLGFVDVVIGLALVGIL